MNLDRDTCYRAVQSRDSRFDGRFFTGVTSTGIYCRPVCPARTPHLSNIRFYTCAAAAEQAGFRPCRRCRPETAPGTPAWLGTSATVSRALRLIGEGRLDAAGIEDLAARLGLGARQLHRLFITHLGVGPTAIAQTRRVHFAREMIETTDLSMTQVALAAGFGSLRRFNALMRRTFDATPTELRQRRRGGGHANGDLVCRLAYRPPYDWPRLISFLQGRAIPGVEAVDGARYTRTIVLDGKPGRLTVSPAPGRNELRLRLEVSDLRGVITVVDRVRRMFDCGADPAAIGAHLGGDAHLAHLVARRPGLRLPSAWDPFEMTVRAILGQQISVAAATTVAERLVARCGTPLASPGDGLTHLFPSPAVLAEADLKDIGLTIRRATTVTGFAAAVADGRVTLDAAGGVSDFVDRLCELPGLGPWTAEYAAMRALGEPDAFPSTDLGLRQAAPDLDLTVASRDWSPWRSYAALHLWASLEDC